MILSDFLVFNEHGLYCKIGDFYLDPQQPVAHAIISHAHGDHAVKGHANVYCTDPTAKFMALRFKKEAGKVFHVFRYHETFTINGVSLKFISAGHILGSAQVVMEYNGITYLYTGDYKLQEDTTCQSFEYIPADVLITETTFADPAIKHPDPAQEIQKLNESIHNVLLGTYSLGKSQRLISLINKYCPQRTVLVHHTILPLNKIYESFSYHPGKYEAYNRKLMKNPEQGFVYLVPPLTFNSYFRAKNVLRVFASGWENLQLQNDIRLFISDHADWSDILQLIEHVNPKEIWTLHGDGRHLKLFFNGKLPVKILKKC
jgi:putative mRNA 3-end processing factor